MRLINAKKHTIVVDSEPILMYAYTSLLSSRVSPDYRFTELLKQFHTLPTLQLSMIQSYNHYLKDGVSCVLIK